jgi:hypothetical protein
MTSYVSHTDLGGGIGAPIDEAAYEPEEWLYMVEHGNVVLRGSDKDPNVLAARAAGEAYEDPRDQRIADLENRLRALGAPVDGEVDEPAPGADEADDEVDPAQVDAQRKVDEQQAAKK